MGIEYGRTITTSQVLTLAYPFVKKLYPNYSEFERFFRRIVYNGAKKIGIKTRFTLKNETIKVESIDGNAIVHLPDDLESLKNLELVGGTGKDLNGRQVPDCTTPVYLVNDFPFVDCSVKCENIGEKANVQFNFVSRPGELIFNGASKSFTHAVIAYYALPLQEEFKPWILELHEEALKFWVIYNAFLVDWSSNDDKNSYRKATDFFAMWELELQEVRAHDAEPSDIEEQTLQQRWNANFGLVLPTDYTEW